MPESYNHIALIGQLTRDPEIRYSQRGTAITKFRLAVDDAFTGQANFVNIIAWEELAERCNTKLATGDTVLVEGRLAIRFYAHPRYVDEHGKPAMVSAHNVVIDKMQRFGEPKRRPARGYGGAGARYADEIQDPKESQELDALNWQDEEYV